MSAAVVKMTPVDGGDSVDIPDGKTTIGRGTFLQVTDKRVSRNHAVLEVNSDGKLVITPIHTNPCFFKLHGTGPQSILQKDQPKILEHGDIVALLPDKLSYRIEYADAENKQASSKDIDHDELKQKDASDEEAEAEHNELVDNDNEELPQEAADDEAGEMAMPLGRKRVLPDWMVGARRHIVTVVQKKKPAKTKPVQSPVKVTSRTTAPKSAAKTKTKTVVATRSPRKVAKLRVVSDDEDEFINDGDEEEDEDFEDDELVSKKRSKRRSGRPTRRSRRARDSDSDDGGKPKRRPRAASLKKPKKKKVPTATLR